MTHFGAVQSGTPDSTVIYFDAAALTAANGRIEIFNSDTALWGLPGSQNHLGEDHVTGSAAGQFTVGQLRDGQVRLRFDEAHDPNTAFDFVKMLAWGFADATFDQTADIRADHITVLTQKHFGQISHADKQHDEHDLTITVTLARDAGDGTIQVWDGSVWATPADSDGTTDGHQASFTVEQLEDGFVRYVHGGGEGGNQSLAWVVTDGDGTVSQTGMLTTAVTAVNDRPTSDDVIRTVDEDGTQSFTKTEIPFADVDARPEDDELHSVKIMSVNYGPGLGGTLRVNDRILGPGDFITADEIDSLTFTPDANQWDSVTVTIPAGQIWQRYNGPVPGVRGRDIRLWEDINDETTNTVTLSWSDLMALRVKPSYKVLQLSELGTYFTQPGTTTDVTATWLDEQDGHPDDGFVKVTVKGDAYIQVFYNGYWGRVTDAVADRHIRTPDTSGADDGIQTLISHDLVAAGHVRVVENRKILTLADLADSTKWHEVSVNYKGMAVDPALLADNKVDLADAQAIAGATLTHKGVTIALTDFAASDLTNKVDLAEAQAIAGATLTHKR